MRTSHWIKLVLIWLSLLVPTVIGVYLAISERRDIGVLGVAGAIFLGVHVIIAPFFGPAINSSGKKYTLKAVQPVLHVSDSGYQWSVTARNEWIRAWFAGPLLLGLGIVSLTAFRSDTGRGPIMPYIGGLLIFLALYLVVKLLATDVAAEMHDNAFTYSSRGFPFHRQEHRILRIDATHFWQHDDPMPVACFLRLYGNTETTSYWRGKPYRTTRSSSVKIPVPYFKNATVDQVESMFNSFHASPRC
ncbi:MULTISPECIES: hypothetical protein [Corynebacterium]|uniref:hypothetical protein n=1 Tax=Corynebacterium TaxID=1716 RepID=UPI0008A5594A|nr:MULTISPECIES: hypothetical protein [Corynebacterium]OFT83647.1 hypothetical protein HMPREF3101_05230 [Corynebacterium sp. HMSC29G08]